MERFEACTFLTGEFLAGDRSNPGLDFFFKVWVGTFYRACM